MPRNLILIHDPAHLAQAPTAPGGFTFHPIQTAQAFTFPALDQFCTDNQFPSNWAATMLSNQAQAILLLNAANLPIAAGWFTPQPFYIAEIRRTVDPRPQCHYYFGDFVSPLFRGQGLQQLLIRQRLYLSQTASHYAIAMSRDENYASVKSYTRAGFIVAASIQSRTVSRWQIDRIRCRRPYRALCKISQEGCRVPLLGLLRRRQQMNQLMHTLP